LKSKIENNLKRVNQSMNFMTKKIGFKTALIFWTLTIVFGVTQAQPGKLLKAGEIMPQGWMKEQIKIDLQEGYYTNFDKINHTVTHNLFVKQDRKSGGSYDGLQCWWSGEHEGYWKDGMLRMAFLSGDEKQKARAIAWLNDIVAAQSPDGYIGIYDDCGSDNCRHNHTGENGELWTQSRIFQALIAGYEFTGNEKWFDALKKAVENTINNDPGNYFNSEKKSFGGVSHGIGFFDALWYLYSQTGEQKYADYAVKLYNDFNNSTVRDDDLKTEKLLSDDKYDKHGAHIAEGLHVPAFIATITNDEKYNRAAARVIPKLKFHITPSGAMVCAENVKKQPGSGSMGYEYCGIAENVQALTKLIAITGEAEVAELAERMTFNAGQGARFPVLTALSYVSTDNRISADPSEKGQRHAFSAFHRAAACCVLNGGRLLPYYIEGMWTKGEDNLTAQLYGPSTLNTVINGVKFNLNQETNYPFEDKIRFTVDPAKPLTYKLRFRIPADAADVTVSGIKGAVKKNGYIEIDRTWTKGDAFTLAFDFPVKRMEEVADSKEIYFKRGPLVFALPIEYKKSIVDGTKNPEQDNNGKPTKSVINPESGFHLYEIFATDSIGWNYKISSKAKFSPVFKGGDVLHPFANSPVYLKGKMLNGSGKKVDVKLVPIGATILRRTTFPLGSKN
jgi:uncharacterized protein